MGKWSSGENLQNIINDDIEYHSVDADVDYHTKTKHLKISELPNVHVSHDSRDDAVYEINNVPNEQAARIVRNILPKVLELYLNKSKDYNGNVMAMLKLGPKASFVDLWRKVGKLKTALWDEQPMVGEQPDEILADLVGHVLIILDEIQQAEQAK